MDTRQTSNKEEFITSASAAISQPLASSQVASYPSIGEGSETILLLHCSASSGAQWGDLSHSLAQQYRVLTPDLYGHGNNTPWHGQAAYSLDREVDLLLQLLAQKTGPIHLVGHSYGAAVALILALRAPERLRSVSLIEPVAPFILRPDNAAESYPLAQLQQVARTVQQALINGDDWAGMAYFINYWNGASAWEQLPLQRQASYAQRIRAISQHFQAVFSTQIEPYELRELAVPTLLVRGGQTPAPTRHIADKLASSLANVNYQIIPNAGHMAPLTHSKAVNALISTHIKSTRCNTQAPGPLYAAIQWLQQDAMPVWADSVAA